MKSFETVSAELKKVKTNNVVTTTVRNINVTDMTTWQRVAITLNTPVKGYVADEEGNYSEGEVNVVFVSVNPSTTPVVTCTSPSTDSPSFSFTSTFIL